MTDKALLLDTHIWLWVASGDSTLSSGVRRQIEKASRSKLLFVSAISVWEIAMLHSKGRINLSQSTLNWINHALSQSEITLLPLSPEIAVESCELPDNFHGDPADRILIATARIENLYLVTRDKKLIEYSKSKYVRIISA